MEKNKITIFCENNGKEYQIPTGSSLKEFKKIVFPTNHQNILGALVNNEVRDLHYEIYNPKYVNFIDVTTLDGYSVYLRSYFTRRYAISTRKKHSSWNTIFLTESSVAWQTKSLHSPVTGLPR